MKKNLHLSLIFLLCYVGLYSQDSLMNKKTKNLEIGLNITSTLAGFFNSGGQNLSNDPYLFSLKFIKPNGATRLGINFSFNERQEFFNNSERKVSERNFSLRAGYEWRETIGTRFTLYYGLDGVGSYDYEKADLFDFNQTQTFKTNNSVYSLGFGPVLGIMFRLHKRIYLSTEGWVYGKYNRQISEFRLNPFSDPEKTKSNGWDIKPVIPSSLYLIFSF